jgi:NAD+ kinase
MKFGIVCDIDDKLALESTENIIEILKARKHIFELEKGLPELLKLKTEGISAEQMTSNIVLAVGSDSTVLRAFRELGKNKIPVLGVNCGTLGFLTEIDVKNFEEALKKIEKRKFFIEERSRIAVQINGKRLPFALNELTISATKGATIIRYALKVNGELIFRDSADGIIVSTPTGSTGYAMSAGGPIVSGNSEVFVIVPLCSLNQNKPFIVSSSSKILISDILSSTACEAIIDGRYRVELEKNVVKISKANVPACFVRFKGGLHSRIFNKLRKKLEAGIIPMDAPPSAKFIYKILQYEGPLTQKEIAKSSMLPSRTVRSALKYLIKNNLVFKQTYIRDTRQSIYFVG